MKGFISNFKANESKEEIIKKLDLAIEEARDKMHKSIEDNGKDHHVTIKLSQKLDPLIVAKMSYSFIWEH